MIEINLLCAYEQMRRKGKNKRIARANEKSFTTARVSDSRSVIFGGADGVYV